MAKVRLPNNQQRIVNVGRTGSGKTVAGLFHLSNYSLRSPWVIFNFKNDEHIDSIPNARHVDFDTIPGKKDGGIFILNPSPHDALRPKASEQSEVEKYLWKLWARENVGIFCDEGYMMNDNDGFAACLTQGRSKRIPMIVCAQRPAWISRFCFSEADFFQVFHLNDERDKKTIEGFVPIDYSKEENLPEHWSWYFDVGKNQLWKFRSVPSIPEIMDSIARKTQKKKWFL
jgi:hypothetical protein